MSEKQHLLGLPECKIMGDVVTNWDQLLSLYCGTAVGIKCAVFVEDQKNWHRMINDNKLSVLETVFNILKPCSHPTDALVCEKQITLSAIYPVLKHVKSALQTDETKDTVYYLLKF